MHSEYFTSSVAYRCVAVKSTCRDDQFECKNIFECIPKAKYRDGIDDCFDKTDEPHISKIVLMHLLITVFRCFVIV